MDVPVGTGCVGQDVPTIDAVPEPSTAPVEAHQLVKRYGETIAVDQVDLTIEAGEIRGLLGPNGAGKTTILAMLFGLVEPDGGSLRVFGRDRGSAGGTWLDGVAGFVETPHFYPYLSGRGNLAHLARLDGGGAPALVDRVLDEVDLQAAADRKVQTYSQGMRQRLGLAASLLRSPRLLIIDEPANGLDPSGVRDLRATLRALAEGGTAVLLSSHDMATVDDVCDTITVLRSGRSVFDGSLARMGTEAPEAAYRLQTSDDRAALDVASEGTVDAEVAGDGLVVRARRDRLDGYVIALGREGIAVRNLTLEISPLEALFFALTEGSAQPARPARGRVGPALIGGRR